jgi:hypothetical protein
MRKRTRNRIWILAGPLLAALLSCDDLKDPPPTAPGPVPPAAPSQFDIAGHWEATSTQGRRIAFDVTKDGMVVNGRINLHHDCNTGRWRATFDGFEGQVVDDAFYTTMNWKANDAGLVREGSVTVSGRFESDDVVKGGFIDSVTDVRWNENNQPTGDVCPTIQGSFEGNKER